MGLTIQTASGGSAFDLQIEDASNDRWFDVVDGDLHSIPTARGSNASVAAKVGQDALPFLDDSMLIRVHGHISGVGATPTLRRASYRTQRTNLRTQLVGAGTLVTLTATPPTLGLASGESATITAQFQRIVAPRPALEDEKIEMTIELLCVSDPVAWSVT